MKSESEVVKQCAVMFVNPVRERTPHPEAMRAMGFVVHEIAEWPTEEAAVREYHVVIVRVKDIDAAPMLAARLAPSRTSDAGLLIALVPAGPRRRIGARPRRAGSTRS